MISLIFDVDEQPWMVIPEVGLGIVSILLAICYAVLDGNVLMLKVVDRMQNQLDRVPAKSDATI